MTEEKTFNQLLIDYRDAYAWYVKSECGESARALITAEKAVRDYVEQLEQDCETLFHDFEVGCVIDEIYYAGQPEPNWELLREQAEEKMATDPQFEIHYRHRIAKIRLDRANLKELREREQHWINLNMLFRRQLSKHIRKLNANGLEPDYGSWGDICELQDKLNITSGLLRGDML
jgi:hypothetical protein